ncbi:MAG TPA: translation initiation factor IF-2 associated domain-containing protein, partial [Steroidobacteraceae bacterium]|nr:translation initiation factor IF-2 associated domain-containing protein [Steroidobacteraceae bacterium]
MADVTVTQFADVLKVPVDRLLTQLDEAGIKVSGADDTISDDAKMELLTHLRRSHGRAEEGASSPRKIILKRKSQGEIKVATAQGRARTVNVEVRTKKTYLNRSVLQEQARHQQEELDRQKQSAEQVREQQEQRDAEKLAAEQRAREKEQQA